MRIFDGNTYRDMTSEEVAAIKSRAIKAQMEERRRPLTVEEVTALLIRQSVNTLEVDDDTALRMMDYYPAWAENTAYSVGYKVTYNGRLWRVVQAHTGQTGWEPENAASLWEQINETHSGVIEDPIPYEGNMVLVNGLYYVQGYKLYLCVRDTENPVYNALSEMVGIYVAEV